MHISTQQFPNTATFRSKLNTTIRD